MPGIIENLIAVIGPIAMSHGNYTETKSYITVPYQLNTLFSFRTDRMIELPAGQSAAGKEALLCV